MASKPISEMTTEELHKTAKSMKIIVTILVASLIVMAASAVYLFIKKGFSATTILPIVFFPLVSLNMANMKKIKAELLSRNNP